MPWERDSAVWFLHRRQSLRSGILIATDLLLPVDSYYSTRSSSAPATAINAASDLLDDGPHAMATPSSILKTRLHTDQHGRLPLPRRHGRERSPILHRAYESGLNLRRPPMAIQPQRARPGQLTSLRVPRRSQRSQLPSRI